MQNYRYVNSSEWTRYAQKLKTLKLSQMNSKIEYIGIVGYILKIYIAWYAICAVKFF